MKASNGREFTVPHKIVTGMSVVVFTKRGHWLTHSEFQAGLRVGQWVEFKVTTSCNDGWIGLKAEDNRYWTAVNSKGSDTFIVVRSTSVKNSYRTHADKDRRKVKLQAKAAN